VGEEIKWKNWGRNWKRTEGRDGWLGRVRIYNWKKSMLKFCKREMRKSL
jgi:hypothetical protein